ncbi:replication factor-A C terminal domain-containing protein [Elsinoe ampelina]|uniref:Replication factor-A C terminal domain-containing protein n=1 Tax=Elsinoe ampelina TaxID=302913 RepID=A0A6A6FY90_9PEZI|nr:replication factor-A C terminal domain-containing protein [Elsinoe ampelina]
MSEEADYFHLKATIVFVKQDSFAYPACLTPECNKKVIEVDPGEWRCEKCDKSHPKPDYRYVMQLNVADYTGQLWLSCFDEVGRMVMGVPANDVQAAREDGDDKKVTDLFQEANCKALMFRCRAKMDTFQDQQRVRYQVLSATPINYAQEAKKLADVLKQYSLDDNNSLFVLLSRDRTRKQSLPASVSRSHLHSTTSHHHDMTVTSQIAWTSQPRLRHFAVSPVVDHGIADAPTRKKKAKLSGSGCLRQS